MSSTNFPFSPRTVGALVRALADGKSHSELTTLFMSLGLERWDRQGERINKETRVQGVIEGMRAADGEAEAKAAVDLARTMVAAGGGRTTWWGPLVDALAADGLDWDEEEEKLIPTVPSLSVPEERSWIGQRLTALGWEDAAVHYRQCADGVAARNWESANGQGRSLLEDLIPRVAAELGGSRAPGEPRAALQFMRDKGLLLDGEYDFARGLWEMCNARGSHAGRSDAEEARFRFLAVSAYARFLLSRLDEPA